MSFARIRPLGLRTRLMVWTSLVLLASLVAGFAWVQHGLRTVLEAKDDALLERKSSELRAALQDGRPEAVRDFEAEIRREVEAYESEGLVIVFRRPGTLLVAPDEEPGREFAARMSGLPNATRFDTLTLSGSKGRYRSLRTQLPSTGNGSVLDMGLSLRGTEATLAQFDARVAAGGLAFLGLAVVGGLILSRQALRPVAVSIRTAQGLNPQNLSARLPLTGADDELDRLATTINDLLDRLAAYHAQAVRFTADASHELRSPLAAMRAAIEVVLQQPRTDEAYRDALVSLGEQCDRLTTLTNGLLLLARADAGQVELRQEDVDLTAIASDIAEMFEPIAEEQGVTLVLRPSAAVLLQGDQSRLRQLTTNLLDNAIKFTEPGGTVDIAVETQDGRAILRVADTGTGIPAEQLPYVFDRFYQASPARSSGGSGLGLSICKWIADAHGGSIRAESILHQGSTVIVSLPLASDVSID
jgi:two-component system OmpR family sensor kinase